jgi:hypothetical protein
MGAADLFGGQGVCMRQGQTTLRSLAMNGIIYLVGLVVVVGVILSFLGLR